MLRELFLIKINLPIPDPFYNQLMFTSNGVVQVLFIEMYKKFLNIYGTMFSYNSFSFIKNNL